jgi:uncharacterized membrane protein
MIRNIKQFVIGFSLLAVLLTACLPSAEGGSSATPIPATESAAPIPTEPPAAAITDTPAGSAVSFTNDVMPILQSRCLNCHGGDSTREGLSVASFDALMAGSNNGPVVVAGDPTNSLLIQIIQEGKMPKRGPKLTPDQLQILIDWIMAGALNN